MIRFGTEKVDRKENEKCVICRLRLIHPSGTVVTRNKRTQKLELKQPKRSLLTPFFETFWGFKKIALGLGRFPPPLTRIYIDLLGYN